MNANGTHNLEAWEMELSWRAHARNWIVLGILAAASLVFWDLKILLGVVSGGILANFNFKLLHRALLNMFGRGKPSVTKALVNYYLRFLVTGAIMLVLLKYQLVNPLGLLIGLSSVVVNLTLTGLFLARRVRFKEAH